MTTVDAPTTPPTTTPSPRRDSSLRRRAITGSLWSLFGFGGGQLVRLAANLALTRLLFPEAFGTMAIINTVVIGLHLFSDLGVIPGIIQSKRGDERAFLDVAWTIQSIRGITLFAVACALAWPAAAFFGDPRLALFIPVVATTAIFDGLCSTKLHALHRHVDVRRFTLIELATQVFSSAVMISWAVCSPTLWALVAGSVAGEALRTALSHRLRGPHNRFYWHLATARELLTFGKWIFLSTLLTFCAEQSDRLVFAKMIPLDLLGVYNIALMLALLPTQAFLRIGQSVFFPSFSRLHQAGGDFRGNFATARRLLSLGGGFAVAGLLACGQPLIDCLYDERYRDAGWMLQLLAAGAWFQILECSITAGLMALGHVRWMAAASLGKVAGMLVLIPLGYHYFGFTGALAGLSAATLVKYGVAVLGARRNALPASVTDLGLTVLVAATGVAGHLLTSWLRGAGAGAFGTLAITGVAITAVWAPWGAVAWRQLRRA